MQEELSSPTYFNSFSLFIVVSWYVSIVFFGVLPNRKTNFSPSDHKLSVEAKTLFEFLLFYDLYMRMKMHSIEM